MKQLSYSERDYTFGRAILTLRTTIGLTQAGLAEYLSVSRRSVGDWEAGNSYPKAEHLKRFIILAFQHQAFPVKGEEEAIRALWQSSRQKILLDEHWLSTLLSQQSFPLGSVVPQSVGIESVRASDRVSVPFVKAPQVDWGEALAVPTFYGREQELAAICQWVLQDRCRVVSVLGMGGIGKSTLVTNAMRRLAPHFQVVIFRSLRDAPSCETILDECLQVLAPLPLSQAPAGIDRRVSLLLEQLRTTRVLIVLDNLETLLEEGDVRGHLRPDMRGYAQLLQHVTEMTHQSCLLLTSREKPAELRVSEGSRAPVRSLRLVGLDVKASEQLLADNGVVGSPQERARLVEWYGGNPLALKIVAEIISDLFGGEIGQFLAQEDMVIFGRIADLLDEQFSRLSHLELEIIYWLAIAREPRTLDELRSELVLPIRPVQVLEAVDGLRRRSLIERGQRPGTVTLQSVVLEYVTVNLVAWVASEIQHGQLSYTSCLIEYSLCQGQEKEHIRQTQERLLVASVLARLQSTLQGQAGVEKRLCSFLDQLRTWDPDAQGYGPANVVTLLRVLRGDLCGQDLSQLLLRDVNLRGIEMQDATLVGSLVRNCVFTETFDAMWAVAISGKGGYRAAASRRGEVRLWKEDDQTLRRVWQAHTDTVCALAFSPNGQALVSGSWDETIKLWDSGCGALIWSVWHPNGVLCLAFSPDGVLLASGGNDATIRIWNIRRETHLQTLQHPSPIFSVAWSPDGRLLASGSFDGSIWLWEICDQAGNLNQSPVCVVTFVGHTNCVRGLAFSPDCSMLASASWDSTVKLWDMSCVNASDVCPPRLCHTLTGHIDRVNRVVWSPDGRTVVSCGFDHTIWLWDTEQRSYRVVLREHTAGVNGVAFTPDSCQILSGSEDGTLRLWNVASGQCVQVLQGYASSLFDIDWSPDSSRLVSGGTDMLVTIWKAYDEVPPRMLRGHRGVIFGVGWSPDGRWLASSAWDKAIYLWDAGTGVCIGKLRDPDNADTFLFGAVWGPKGSRGSFKGAPHPFALLESIHPGNNKYSQVSHYLKGELLASGTYMHGVLVWDVEECSYRWVGDQTPTWIRHVAWSPNGTCLAGGGDDGNVYLWDVADGSLLWRLSGHHGGVTSIAWHPNGTRLASVGRARGGVELFLWDVQNGESVRTFEGHPGVIYAVSCVLEGDRLVSGGSDGMLRWWDAQSCECVQKRQAHQGAVLSLRRSPDGRRLASCGDDGAIMLWDAYGGEHLRTLRRDRPYERLNIAGIRGLSEVQKDTLCALGAVEH